MADYTTRSSGGGRWLVVASVVVVLVIIAFIFMASPTPVEPTDGTDGAGALETAPAQEPATDN